MSRQSQILFLSDVGVFIVHVWCATQTRPRFNVPSERRSTTTRVGHPYPSGTGPGPGFEPGTFCLGGERSIVREARGGHPGIQYILGFKVDSRCIFRADSKSGGGRSLSVGQFVL